MKIKKKFTLEVLLLSVLLVLISFVSINNTTLVERNFYYLNNQLIQSLSLLKDMRLVASNLLAYTLEFTLLEDEFNATKNKITMPDPKSSDILFEIERSKAQFAKLLSLYKSMSQDQTNLQYANDIEHQWKKFELLSNKFIEYRKGGISGSEFIKIKEEFKDSKNALFREIDLIIIKIENSVDEKTKSVAELVVKSIIILLTSLLIFIFAVILLRHYTLKSILNPVLMIRNATKKIADGDLKTRLEYISKDEIGELSQDINQMAQDLESSQEKLLKSEKLSVIGALAERMAHDIRNPLAIIMNAADQIKIKYKDNEESDFTIMNKAIKRISHQVQDVLDFVRSTPLLPEKVSLSSMLKQAIENEGIPEGIELVLPQGDLDLVCDRRKIEVVFANLIRNAVDAAMPRGKIQVRIADLNDKVRIEIEDSGQGISPENQARIFDPLFTTKQIGTGLGLTSVKNIVTEHGGTITFSTNPTIFAVEIPKMLY